METKEAKLQMEQSFMEGFLGWSTFWTLFAPLEMVDVARDPLMKATPYNLYPKVFHQLNINGILP